MFNLYSKELKEIPFMSNPPIGEVPQVVPDFNNAKSPVNRIVRVPKSNHSPFEGVHYIAEEMSLRAKLNLGVNLTRVANVNIDNDPAVVQRNLLIFEKQVQDKLNEFEFEAKQQPVSENVNS